MTENSLFYLVAQPLIYNIPKALTILLVLFLILPSVFDFFEKKYYRRSKKKFFLSIKFIFIIVLGLYYRLYFAYYFKGDFDLHYWYQAADMVIKGKNIYAVSSLYTYFPPWILILIFLKKINILVPSLHFYFLVRLFLTFIDLISLYLLLLIAKIDKLSVNKILVGFFLNPVMIIITGFHGQFENIAILFILLGIYSYKKQKNFFLSWLSFTFGGIVKHMFFNQPLIFLNQTLKNRKKVIYYFILSILIAGATLLPYWKGAGNLIIRNMLLSVYTTPKYGFLLLLEKIHLSCLTEIYKYFFIIYFFVFPFFVKKNNLITGCLLGVLYFVAFSPGISDQFFILPIALGSLTASSWFYTYSLAASLYLFGSPAQFKIPIFKIFSWNLIFIVSLIWFIIEYRKKNEAKS